MARGWLVRRTREWPADAWMSKYLAMNCVALKWHAFFLAKLGTNNNQIRDWSMPISLLMAIHLTRCTLFFIVLLFDALNAHLCDTSYSLSLSLSVLFRRFVPEINLLASREHVHIAIQPVSFVARFSFAYYMCVTSSHYNNYNGAALFLSVQNASDENGFTFVLPSKRKRAEKLADGERVNEWNAIASN